MRSFPPRGAAGKPRQYLFSLVRPHDNAPLLLQRGVAVP